MYKLKRNDTTDIWEVYEVPTGQSVITYDNEEAARSMVRSLNLGSGFQGFTPGFMTVDYSLSPQTKRKAVREEQPFI